MADAERKVQIEVYFLYAEDSHGNDFSAVVSDLSDTVQVYGLQT
jgi:hypothetical protein